MRKALKLSRQNHVHEDRSEQHRHHQRRGAGRRSGGARVGGVVPAQVRRRIIASLYGRTYLPGNWRIAGRGPSGVDHSTAGAQQVLQLGLKGRDKGMAELIAYAIAGHHAGLPDMSGETGGLIDRLKKTVAPLDPVWREEIDKYVRKHRLRFRDDASNKNLAPLRNRIRHRILPHIAHDNEASSAECSSDRK